MGHREEEREDNTIEEYEMSSLSAPVHGGSNLRRSLATKTTSKSEILRLDGHTLGMDGSQVGIFEE